MLEELVRAAVFGDKRAIARLISIAENDGASARKILKSLYPYTGKAHIIGITGAPGTGKSTLVNELAKEYRLRGLKVGIVAVDPSSPFTGGAILGDRIRMRDLYNDPGVFIRSMATRGSLGGLARATADAVKILDAAGYEKILVETVGAGQTEVDIASTAHTTIVVEVPGLGDDIQAIKAGLLEIADVFVVNKADLEGADGVVLNLETMMSLGNSAKIFHHGILMEIKASFDAHRVQWRPPVCKTIATRGEGIKALVEAIERHWAFLKGSGAWEEKERLRASREIEEILRMELLRRILAKVDREAIGEILDKVVKRELDPYTAAEKIAGVGEL
ncbi:MAG: methylmalonyl Co-A mutase-associated GTPase MeaB [Anaerolineae bacterium]|nr:methylmalonyl Co-A mutase-associated GTPase MeaB [Anaerolineae bacterium]MDW8102107.1 methylmalonyl Co-A mutase-associated GTPase MeaB [Anaerolineae bacterium]